MAYFFCRNVDALFSTYAHALISYGGGNNQTSSGARPFKDDAFNHALLPVHLIAKVVQVPIPLLQFNIAGLTASGTQLYLSIHVLTCTPRCV